VEKSHAGSVKNASQGRAPLSTQRGSPSKRGREKTAYGKKVRRLLMEGKTSAEVFKIVGGNKQAIYNIKHRMKKEPKQHYAAPARARTVVQKEPKKLSLWQSFKQWFGIV
jgi:DNA-binding CsgD family transcriptional regulator